MPEPALLDRLGRPLGTLRLSVTDRCNLRCRYCMPADHYVWLPRESLLSFEELTRLAGVFAGLGVRDLRLTGGEPLLRRDLPALVRGLRAVPGLHDLALTTNGTLLAAHARALAAAGLDRVTVSLDTLDPARAEAFSRTLRHADVLAGIGAARSAGLEPVKVNTVVIRGFNDDEPARLVAWGREAGVEIRFIEYMDVGGATEWEPTQVVPRAEILEQVASVHGPPEPLPSSADPAAPAERFRLPDGTVFGVIASVTQPFCRTCDRARLTADGTLFLCLYADAGIDLRAPLREGASDDELASLVRSAWQARTDRGAEARHALGHRSALHDLVTLRADPRREMHTRGG